MAQVFPTADLYALTAESSSSLEFGGRTVTTTALDRIPWLRERRDLQLPLMPLAWRYASRQRYDIVVTSSHACAKGFWPGRATLHLSYCYTPLRYVWEAPLDERRRRNAVTAGVARALRVWDLSAVRWVDEFAAISRAVASRIKRCYGRASQVIHPPVDTSFFTPSRETEKQDFALAVGRMVPYKRLDLAIGACHRAGVRLVVAGSGADEPRLRALSDRLGADVTFVISPDDPYLRELYRSAQMVVFPAEEDFGIVTPEAQACGTPVVAFGRGGSTDTIVDGQTGVLVREQTEAAFAQAIYEARRRDFSPGDFRINSVRFSQRRFHSEFSDGIVVAANSRVMLARH